MTQKQNDLLLKDLCGRLPYGVKIDIPDLFVSTKINIEVLNEIFCGDDGEFRCNNSGMLIKYVKPYLFPLESMTEEQKIIYGDLCYAIIHSLAWDTQAALNELVDWLNENHFDYNNLIPMGLANDATGLNIY